MRFREALAAMEEEGRRFTVTFRDGARSGIAYGIHGNVLMAYMDPCSSERTRSGLTVAAALQADWEEVVLTHDFAWAKEQIRAGRSVTRPHRLRYDARSLFDIEDTEATDWVLA